MFEEGRGMISKCLLPFWLDYKHNKQKTANITNNMYVQTEPISFKSSPLFTFAVMPSISVKIFGSYEELLVMRVQDSDTIGQIIQRISARTGVPLFELHLSGMTVHADPDNWSDLASDADATSEEEFEAPDAWEAFYGVDPMWMRPPAGPAPGAPVLGAATAAAVAAVAAAAAAAAPAPGATTHGAAPDAPVPGAASQQAATSSQRRLTSSSEGRCFFHIIRQGAIP